MTSIVYQKTGHSGTRTLATEVTMDSIHVLSGIFLTLVVWSGTGECGSDVSLSNAIIDQGGKSFHIECNFTQFVQTLQKNNPNDQIKYHVRFLADKTPIVDRDLTASEVTVGKAFLSYDAGIDKNMNKNYRCEVTGHVGGSKKISTSTSESKFLGIRAEQARLNVTEGHIKNLTIVSTVPILCERSFGKCCLELDLQIGSHRNQLATFTKCFYEVCKDDWNETIGAAVTHIPVVANPDAIKDGNTDLRIKFRPLIPSGGGQVHQVFENAKIPSVPVSVIDAPEGVCGIGGDPHIVRFSKSRLSFQEVGDYVHYQNRQQDFDVHIRTWPCSLRRRITCVSGILVHDGNDVLRISLADNINVSPNILLQSIQRQLIFFRRNHRLTLTTDHRNLPDGTNVTSNNRFVQVNTPSGARLAIRHVGMSLDFMLILPPQFRQDATQGGLCGKMGDPLATWTDRHGHTHRCNSWRPNGQGCRSLSLTQSWKLDRNSTLFYNPPQAKPNRETDKTIYCGCADDLNQRQTPLINCTGDGNKSPVRKGCTMCTNSQVGKGIYGGTFGKRNAVPAGDQPTSFDPFKYNAEFPNETGPVDFPNITADELDNITKTCQAALDGAVLKSQCTSLTHIQQDYLDQCIDDAVLMGDFTFNDNAVNGYNSMCLHELQADPKNYVTRPDGTLAIKDSIAFLCSQNCHLHGTCNKGKCVCDSDWQGADCDLPVANNTTPSTTTTATTKAGHSSNVHTTAASPLATTTNNPSAKIKLIKVLKYINKNASIMMGDSCDMSQNDCNNIVLLAQDYPKSTHNIHCVWMKLESIHNNTVLDTRTNLARLGHNPNEIRCHLPFGLSKIGADKGQPYQALKLTLTEHHQVVADHAITTIIYDSNCVKVANGAVTPSGKSCIIEGQCHSDGSHNVLVDGEQCVASVRIDAWSKVSDQPINTDHVKLKLTGPDVDLKVTCHADGHLGNFHARRTVDWYVNDRKVKSGHLAPLHTNTAISLLDVWGSGPPLSVQCRMESGPPANVVYISDPIKIV